jgi:hypothetical protein
MWFLKILHSATCQSRKSSERSPRHVSQGDRVRYLRDMSVKEIEWEISATCQSRRSSKRSSRHVSQGDRARVRDMSVKEMKWEISATCQSRRSGERSSRHVSQGDRVRDLILNKLEKGMRFWWISVNCLSSFTRTFESNPLNYVYLRAYSDKVKIVL